LTTPHVLELWSTRKNNADPFTFVGDFERIFYNPVTKSIRVSDGNTPGGIPISEGGSGSAEALYTSITPPAGTNGLLWFNPSTDTLYVASDGVWVEVGSSGSEGAVTLYSTTTPAADVNGRLWYNPNTGILSIVVDAAWVAINSVPDITDIAGIEIVNPAAGDALLYDGTAFKNIPLNLSGGTDNQVLVKKSNSNYDYEWEDMIINIPDNVYTRLLDQVSDTVLYIGEAAPESLETSAVWRIQRIIFDALGNVEEVRYAEGGLFDQIWNNRTLLTYI
jgi:hypothetical protein